MKIDATVIAVLLLVGLAVLMLYLWPTLRAVDVRHPDLLPIFIVNALLGWLLIPWALALAWAYRHKRPANGATKRCTYCSEEIMAEAIKCKHCQSMLT
jgi:uncharacterized membrane protein